MPGDVTCPACRQPASEWAAACPRCGCDLAGAEPLPPAPGPEPPAAPSSPSRRRRRRDLTVAAGAAAAVVVAAIVVAGVVVGLSSGPSGPTGSRHRALAAPAAGYVVDLNANQLQVLDLATGRLRNVAGAGALATFPAGLAKVSATTLVFVDGGHAYAWSSPFAGSMRHPSADGPRPLGPATWVLAGASSGQVWLVRGLPNNGQGSATVEEWTVRGSALSRAVTLPSGAVPMAAVPGGLLLTSSQSQLEVWSPARRSVTRPLGPVATFIGAFVDHGSADVAWTVPLAGGGCLDGQCPLQVESVGESAGLACVVQPPAGHEGFWGGGAFSPDGSKLAAFVAAPAGSSPSAQVALVDVTDCSSQVLPSTPPVPVGEPLGSAHWSPDGTWLYFCGLSGPLHTYHLGHPGTGSLPLPSSYAFAAF